MLLLWCFLLFYIIGTCFLLASCCCICVSFTHFFHPFPWAAFCVSFWLQIFPFPQKTGEAQWRRTGGGGCDVFPQKEDRDPKKNGRELRRTSKSCDCWWRWTCQVANWIASKMHMDYLGNSDEAAHGKYSTPSYFWSQRRTSYYTNQQRLVVNLETTGVWPSYQHEQHASWLDVRTRKTNTKTHEELVTTPPIRSQDWNELHSFVI